MEENQKVPFYKKTWFIILMLIFVFPVGLILMWKYKDWSRMVKSVVTAATLLFALSVYTSDDDTEETASTTEEEVAAEESVEEKVEEETPVEEESAEEVVEEETPVEEESSEETDQSERIENIVIEYTEDKAAITEVNTINVEESDDGHYVLIDYLHYDNPSGYAYLVQIEGVIEEMVELLADEDIYEFEFIAEANISRDGESVQDTVYEAIFNDLRVVARDNIEETSGYLWINPLLEE